MILYVKIELVKEDYSIKEGESSKAKKADWTRSGEMCFCVSVLEFRTGSGDFRNLIRKNIRSLIS